MLPHAVDISGRRLSPVMSLISLKIQVSQSGSSDVNLQMWALIPTANSSSDISVKQRLSGSKNSGAVQMELGRVSWGKQLVRHIQCFRSYLHAVRDKAEGRFT